MTESLEQLWRGHEPGPDAPDPEWVERTYRRRSRGHALNVVGEVVGGGGAIAAATWFVRNNPMPQTIALVVMTVVIVAASWVSTWRAVRALRRGREVTTENHLKSLLSDARVMLEERRRYDKLALLSAALVIPWALFVLVTKFDVYAAEPWRGAVGFGGMAVIFLGLRWKIRATVEALEDEVQRLSMWLQAFAFDDVTQD